MEYITYIKYIIYKYIKSGLIRRFKNVTTKF